MNNGRERGLTIIIPCLDEELTIGACVREAVAGLKSAAIPGEVLVVNNGSTDGSVAKALEAGARVITEENRGYGSAYLAGIRNAGFEYCLKGDADGSYDFGQVPLFWDELQKGKADIVLGSRFKGTIMPGAMPFLHRYFGTPALTFLINSIYHGRLSDINSGMRAFKTRTMLDLGLTCTGMEFASEMLVKALKKRLWIQEIPITLRKDQRNRKPHLKSFRDGWKHLRFIVLMSPYQLFFYPGALCISAGLTCSAVLLFANGAKPQSHLYMFGLTTFACVQNLILLGEVLILFSYMAKLRLIHADIDFPSRIIDWIEKELSINRILVAAGAGLALNLAWTADIAVNLFRSYAAGAFSAFYTKLGMFNFTLHISLIMLLFAAFFISDIGIEKKKNTAQPGA